MLGCINDIQNCIFETINDEWKQFRNETSSVTDIKTVTDAHMSFLESITKYTDESTVVSYTNIIYCYENFLITTIKWHYFLFANLKHIH
jgi:uncharacterized protein (UPF0305 family)